MFEPLVWATLLVCAVAATRAYASTRDVFHPAILFATLSAFIYGYLPLSLLKDGNLFLYVKESQAEFCQVLALLGISALMAGCFKGAAKDISVARSTGVTYSPRALQNGAYSLGVIGMICWFMTIEGGGGFTVVYGRADGVGWSPYGYVRDATYLLVVALILLLTKESLRNRDRKWLFAVVSFAAPWLMQGLLGARRGPTFLIAGVLAMSWYLSNQRRPSVFLLGTGATALGCLMLFLVTNRDRIYLGSDFKGFKTDITSVVTEANESNEYIFGIGCIETARQTEHYFWGRRYLAQLFVRPIPRQLWPNKYEDFGVGELEQNAGVAGPGLMTVMGWGEVPGAAAAMIADLWVEFSWLYLPVLYLVGYAYGSVWRRAVTEGGVWSSQYTIIAILAVYFVTQSGEAIIFRVVILSLPTQWFWRKAREIPSILTPRAVPL